MNDFKETRMRKILIVLCMVFVTASVFAQGIDVSKIDLSNARMSLAGKDRIYIANIYYQGARLSVLLESDGAYGAIIYGPWFDDDKLLQDDYEFGHASLRIQGDDTLIISDIVLGGQGYSGRFKYDGVNTITYNAAWQTETPIAAEMQVADLKEQLQNTRKRYEEQLRAVGVVSELELGEVQNELAAAKSANDVAASNLAAAKSAGDAKARELERELAAVRKAAESAGADVSVVTADTLPSRARLSGFSSSRAVSGSWTAGSTRAAQNDANAYYAKLRIPLAQSARETLYSFDARATGTGYVGYGLHFFVSGEVYGAGYGYGRSYLVWLTRDPGYYGTDDTYVQLYRSDDDVAMFQMASATIADSITSANSTDVLYDPSTGRITVSVNGTEYLSAQVKSPIRSGSSIALRALGTAVFTDLTVKTN
jgi:hypothetical protein